MVDEKTQSQKQRKALIISREVDCVLPTRTMGRTFVMRLGLQKPQNRFEPQAFNSMNASVWR